MSSPLRELTFKPWMWLDRPVAGSAGDERYRQLCDQHRWEVPARCNIAAEVCDRHPADALAMVHEHYEGAVREVHWGELQGLANQAANLLAGCGVKRGDRVAVVLPPTPETAAVFFATWKLGAILLSMSVLYGDEGIAHRLNDSQPKVLITDAANAARFDGAPVERVLVLDAAMLAAESDACETADTAADDPAQLYYTSGTTGLAKGIVHAHRYIIGHNEFELCHEVQPRERFHGMGEWAWAAGICPLLGPWRLGAVQMVYQRKGGFDPHKQLDFLSRHQVTNVFATPTAIRSMMGIADARERYPQQFRVVCSAGEPLNPEAIRWFRSQYDVTVLDYYGLTESYPLCGNFPWMEVREGSMGRPMPGWDVAILDQDEQPVPQGERGEICLRARSNPHYPLGYWRLRQESEETFGGEWFHTKDAARMDEDGYVWYEGRADDVIIAAGYRIGPFEVESVCLEHDAVAEAAAVASPDERRGSVVKAYVVLAAGHQPSEQLAEEIKAFVRDRLSAYAYPRLIEFVPDLPKTLTGKIRRIELRERAQREARRHPAVSG
jgi:acetyl-CoA synthetase